MFSVESKEAKAARLKSEILLSDPRNEGDENEEKKIFERATCSYQNLSERFLFKVGQKNFSRQYSHIYSVRLMAMRKMLAAAARRKWGKSCVVYYSWWKRIEGEGGEGISFAVVSRDRI